MAWNWNDQGTPPGEKIDDAIAAVSYQGRPYVFIRATDGHLWVNWWDGSAWHWNDQGTPPGKTVDHHAMAAISYDSRPYVFTHASDGHLWVNWWS